MQSFPGLLNSNNQSHDIKNLFITDASFFPSSGGVNPSLTIAANALRVAEIINKNWDQNTG
jgi:choline dehydrogenase-like flavoprotein